ILTQPRPRVLISCPHTGQSSHSSRPRVLISCPHTGAILTQLTAACAHLLPSHRSNPHTAHGRVCSSPALTPEQSSHSSRPRVLISCPHTGAILTQPRPRVLISCPHTGAILTQPRPRVLISCPHTGAILTQLTAACAHLLPSHPHSRVLLTHSPSHTQTPLPPGALHAPSEKGERAQRLHFSGARRRILLREGPIPSRHQLTAPDSQSET
uniref:Uncharacterized protein n=1 Tax=Malurus cyaneus samueli TaxID=2593467 RepID=A0A8C5X3S3_9PASS